MTDTQKAQEYIDSQTAPKRADMQAIHTMVLETMPGCKIWFTDGKNEDGKVVSNPNIGYGAYTIRYANGNTKEFFRVGLSANTTGISVYILGLEDKMDLASRFAKTIGKASVTGYCIKFRALSDIDPTVLQAAVKHGAEADSGSP